MARHQRLAIQMVSDSDVNAKDDLIQLLKDTTTATTPLGGVFFVTLVGSKRDVFLFVTYTIDVFIAAEAERGEN